MKTLRTALVGVGRIGWRFHLPAIEEHAGFELTAVADVEPARLEETKSRYCIRTYTDYIEMLDLEDLDLVVICSPTHLHEVHAVSAFQRGIDVFLDKPVAATPQAARRVLDESERQGRKLMMYQPWRLRPETLAVRGILSSGRLGRIYMARLYRTSFVRRNDWQAMRVFGGGTLNNTGAHLIDLMIYLFEQTPWTITGKTRAIATAGDAEDVVKILAETDEGLIIDLEINDATAVDVPRWTLLGDHGSAVSFGGDDRVDGFELHYIEEGDLEPPVLNQALAAKDREYMDRKEIPWRRHTIDVGDFTGGEYYGCCYNFYAEDREPLVPLSQTREVLSIMAQCQTS